MSKEAIATAQVAINNEVIAYVPNTLKFSDGFGEYTQRAGVVGSGRSEVVFSENAEGKKGKCSFEMFPTADNIEVIRSWKAGRAGNVIEILATGMQRSFTGAAIINDVENQIGADTTISIEWESDPAS